VAAIGHRAGGGGERGAVEGIKERCTSRREHGLWYSRATDMKGSHGKPARKRMVEKKTDDAERNRRQGGLPQGLRAEESERIDKSEVMRESRRGGKHMKVACSKKGPGLKGKGL